MLLIELKRCQAASRRRGRAVHTQLYHNSFHTILWLSCTMYEQGPKERTGIHVTSKAVFTAWPSCSESLRQSPSLAFVAPPEAFERSDAAISWLQGVTDRACRRALSPCVKCKCGVATSRRCVRMRLADCVCPCWSSHSLHSDLSQCTWILGICLSR